MRINQGQFVILFVVVVAIAAAVVAWWVQYTRGRQAKEFWSTSGAQIVRFPDQVEGFVLDPPVADAAIAQQQIEDDSRWSHVDKVDITRARGLVHARQALIVDASYDWDSEDDPTAARLTHALRFTDGSDRVLVLLDLERRWLRYVQGDRQVRMGERLAAGLRTFLGEQLGAGSPHELIHRMTRL